MCWPWVAVNLSHECVGVNDRKAHPRASVLPQVRRKDVVATMGVGGSKV